MKRIRDVARVSDSTVLFIGFFAGVVTSLFLFALDTVGWNHVSLVLLWGELASGRTDTFGMRLGFSIHLISSAVLAFIYSRVFISARRSGAFVGMQVALIHWAISGLMLSLLPPGLFAFRAGYEAAISFFMVHLVFGATVGAMFDRAAVGFDHPRPIGPVRRDQRELSRSQRVRGTIRA